MSSQEGVQVQVGVGKQGPTKSPAALDEVLLQAAPTTAAATACSNGNCSSPKPWSSKCMWGLFLLGWLFPPAWCAGLAGGLRCGKDDECFIKRRKGMTTSTSIAWAANLLMSIASALVLILVLSIVYGRPGAQQEGEWPATVSCRKDSCPAGTAVHVLSAEQSLRMEPNCHAVDSRTSCNRA